MLASRLLPTSWKRRILRRTRGVDEEDVFPTWYRANTPRRLRSLLREAGWEVSALEAREFQPCEYLSFSGALYACACAYDLAVRHLGLETSWGAHILGMARKPAHAPRVLAPLPTLR